MFQLTRFTLLFYLLLVHSTAHSITIPEFGIGTFFYGTQFNGNSNQSAQLTSSQALQLNASILFIHESSLNLAYGPTFTAERISFSDVSYGNLSRDHAYLFRAGLRTEYRFNKYKLGFTLSQGSELNYTTTNIYSALGEISTPYIPKISLDWTAIVLTDFGQGVKVGTAGHYWLSENYKGLGFNLKAEYYIMKQIHASLFTQYGLDLVSNTLGSQKTTRLMVGLKFLFPGSHKFNLLESDYL